MLIFLLKSSKTLHIYTLHAQDYCFYNRIIFFSRRLCLSYRYVLFKYTISGVEFFNNIKRCFITVEFFIGPAIFVLCNS